jgi:hypothetical protein
MMDGFQRSVQRWPANLRLQEVPNILGSIEHTLPCLCAE